MTFQAGHISRCAARYALAVLFVVAAFLLRQLLVARVGELPHYVTFYPAIMLAAMLAGFGPGLLAIGLSAVMAGYWVLPPADAFFPMNMNDAVGLVLFCCMGMFMILVAGLYRRGRQSIAEYELRAKERANLQAVFDSVNVGMFLINERGEIKQVNNTVLRWAHKEPAECSGFQPGDILGCIHARREGAVCGQTSHCGSCRIRQTFAEALRTGKPVRDVEAEAVLSANGSELRLWVEASADPLVIEGKRHVVLALNNITERRLAEQALRESEERRKVAEAVQMERQRFNEVLNMLPAYVVLLSPDYHVPFANRFFEERFGTSGGRRCFEYLFHRSEPCENCETYKVLKSNTPHRWEWTGPDGRTYDIYDFPFTDVDGAPLIMEMGIDVTETKRAERALREANETLEQRVAERTSALAAAKQSAEEAKAAAEVANEAKGRFLANVSHELRTPMNAILGMIDLALPRQTDPNAKDFLVTARESADLLLVLLNDLLDCAKIESGKLGLESVPFSLRRMMDQIARVLAVRASEKGICFSCDIPPQVPDAIVGDEVRLRQILLNLAGNGIKFTENGAVVISVRAESQNGAEVLLRFEVRDTGIGIPASALQRVFQPFAQAAPSTTRQFGGTGLGLTIASNLVEMMGGRIGVESRVGTGSTFHFVVRMPLAKELPADIEAPADVPATASARLRVLLAEDNPANQKVAAYILQDRGHAVDIVGDGQNAVRLAQENRYDVILMDMQMPGMNGLEAVAAIRKHEPGAGGRVPIIAMTAHAMEGDRERCLAAGMDGYLSKPIDIRQMIALVESLAAERRGAGAASVSNSQAEAKAPKPPEGAVFDRQAALSRCLGSPKMLREMIQCFLDDVDSLVPQMRSAVKRGDLTEFGRLGHRLKGTLVYLGAAPAKEAAMRIERFEQLSDSLADAENTIELLHDECEALKAALAEYLRADARE